MHAHTCTCTCTCIWGKSGDVSVAIISGEGGREGGREGGVHIIYKCT